MRCEMGGCPHEALNTVDGLDICDGCKAEWLAEQQALEHFEGTPVHAMMMAVPGFLDGC